MSSSGPKDVIRYLNHPATVSPSLRWRQLVGQRSRTTPWVATYWNENTICPFLVKIFCESAISASRHQNGFIPHVPSFPQIAHQGWREVTVPEDKVNVITMVTMKALYAVDPIKRRPTMPPYGPCHKCPEKCSDSVEVGRQMYIVKCQRMVAAFKPKQCQP